MQNTKLKQKITKALILAILLISIFVSANHHHKDLQPHYDCPVCLFQINSSSSDVSSTDIVIKPPENTPLLPVKKETFVFTQKLQRPNQRAPPYYPVAFQKLN